MHIFNTGCTGEILCRLLVITGNQACVNAKGVQASHCFSGVGPQRIAERQQTDKCSVACHGDHRQALRFKFVNSGVVSRDVHCFRRKKTRAANHKPRIPKACFHAFTQHGLEFPNFRERDAAIKRFFDHRTSEWVLGTGLYRCCEGQ